MMLILPLVWLTLSAQPIYTYDVKIWTMNELSNVIQGITTCRPDMMPFYEDAFNQIMYALFVGKGEEIINAVMLSPTGRKKWKKSELERAIQESTSRSPYSPFLHTSLAHLEEQNSMDSIEVVVPAMEISTWSLQEVENYMNNTFTRPELLPYLHRAVEQYIEEGKKNNNVTVVTPVGYVSRPMNIEQPIIVPKE